MRFPFSLTRSMAGYLLKKKLRSEKRFPLVLMLEPLHACNLKCTGCGRIREYADTAGQTMTVEECLESVEQCGAPIVSLCGGEPLIYPGLVELIEKILARKKHIYLCTNGSLLEKKLNDLPRHRRLFINVHLDGLEATHDRCVQQKGIFAKAVAGIRAAKAAGYMVCTNTTIYKETDMREIDALFEQLTKIGVDGFLLSPSYGYEVIHQDDPSRAEQIFLTRNEIHTKFREAEALLTRHRLHSTPLYMEFLRGTRELTCAAWANPTRNVCGWKGPCYLITDRHYATYGELVESTDWEAIGPGNDPRCEHCLVHCGFEPAAVLAANRRLRDMLKMTLWQFS